jgi:PTH1 family peptidyl-tRNA hydrolase
MQYDVAIFYTMKYLIVGLGNIGPEYQYTRHNIGFMVLDDLAAKLSAKFDIAKLAFRAEIKHKGRTLILIKPTTYMNLSGKALNYWMKEEKVPLENIVVITDDIAIPFGKLRMRGKGSNGGHNGLGNIQEVIGTDSYCRIRFGVGSEFGKGKQVDYVLGEFSKDEQAGLGLLIDKVNEGILNFTTIGLERTMNILNSVTI